jgi:hypothetical protein
LATVGYKNPGILTFGYKFLHLFRQIWRKSIKIWLFWPVLAKISLLLAPFGYISLCRISLATGSWLDLGWILRLPSVYL